MKHLFFLLFLAQVLIVHGQKMPDPKPFANSITEDGLKKHLYIIASKDFEGRETATEGQRKAAAYIEQQFRLLHLQGGNNGNFQLNYAVFQDSLIDGELEVNEQHFVLDQDFAVNTTVSHTATLFGSEVVFAGFGISDSLHDDYKNLDAKGKIVLILNGEPAGYKSPGGRRGANLKIRLAQYNGAVALLIIQTNFTSYPEARKGNMYQNAYRNSILPNTYYVSEKIAEAIMGSDYATAKLGHMPSKSYLANVMLQYDKKSFELHSSDVLGYLEGTDLKDQVVVISAHYDHLGKKDTVIYFGADDDGSGTVSVLEIAEAFSKAKTAGKGPRRSILFLANSGEEKGLWGSEYYSDHPLYPLSKTTVDLNIDMIGRIDPHRKKGDSTNYVYVVGDDKLSSDLKPISEAINNKYTRMELDYKFNDPKDPERIFYRSDHFNFARKGVPIIFYFDGIHNDYHQPSDTPDKINYDILRKRAQFIFFTAWEMANRDALLKRDIPLPSL